jgi:methyl-accepting chemotaxis protein
LTAEKSARKKVKAPPKGRKLLRRTLFVVLLLQLLAFVVAGAAFYFIGRLDIAKDFYSAHRSLKSIQNLLLPAAAVAGGAAFILVTVTTWVGFHSYSAKFALPILRADDMLKRLAHGDLTYTGGVLPSRQRWALDDSASAVLAAFREKVTDIQRLNREINNLTLSLSYKATSSEPLTLEELREAMASLDGLCKKLNNTLKWFET